MGRAALELIGQGGFGHSFDPLVENVPNAYADAIKDFVYVLGRLCHLRLNSPSHSPTSSRLILFRLMGSFLNPIVDLCQRRPAVGTFVKRHFHLVPHSGLQHMKSILDILDDTSRRIYAEKMAALDSNDEDLKIKVTEGRDLMSVMREYCSRGMSPALTCRVDGSSREYECGCCGQAA